MYNTKQFLLLWLIAILSKTKHFNQSICFSNGNRMVSIAISEKFEERWAVFKGRHSLSYHESSLSLITGETIRLLVNHQLVTMEIQPKSISLDQACYKSCFTVTSLHCLLSSTSKNKYLKRISTSFINLLTQGFNQQSLISLPCVSINCHYETWWLQECATCIDW